MDTYGFRLEERSRVQLNPARLAEKGISGPLAGELLRKGSVEVAGRAVPKRSRSA